MSETSKPQYNRVRRDKEPGRYNFANPNDYAYQFYFTFVEPVTIPTRGEVTRFGVTVHEDHIDKIPEGESAYETAVAIRDHKRDDFLYSGDLKDLEAIVQFLESTADEDWLKEAEWRVHQAEGQLLKRMTELNRARAELGLPRRVMRMQEIMESA